MKQRFTLFAIVFVLTGFPLFSQVNFSGLLESTINYTAGAGEAPPHSFGIEEYANIRLRLRTGENAIFNAAFNLIAWSGNYAQAALGMGTTVKGENYAALLELERLYFRINGEKADTEAGLLRMPFGYGNVWGSMDFLNPRNPLVLNARPRGVLGANVSFFPSDSAKLTAFASAPKNPFVSDGGGFVPGLLFENHWNKASLQTLYAYETPLDETKQGLHRFGLSAKGDLEAGLVADILYTLNPDNADGIDGLSAGAGFDYSFLGGDLYVLFEYLFNGSSSVTALGRGGYFSNSHYLNGIFLYRLNDYSSLSLSAVFCFDDLSFQPIFTLDYEIFQGFSLNLSAILPLDPKDEAGELGPEQSRASFMLNAGARLRF